MHTFLRLKLPVIVDFVMFFFISYYHSELTDAYIDDASPLAIGMASHFITSMEPHILIVLDPRIENLNSCVQVAIKIGFFFFYRHCQ